LEATSILDVSFVLSFIVTGRSSACA
jgi:hypothetical protein